MVSAFGVDLEVCRLDLGLAEIFLLLSSNQWLLQLFSVTMQR